MEEKNTCLSGCLLNCCFFKTGHHFGPSKSHISELARVLWVKDGQGQKLSLYMVLLRRCHLRKFSALFQIVNMSGLAPPATFTNPKCDYVCSLCSCPHVCTPTLATFTHAMHLSKFGDIMAVFRGGGR